MNILLDALSVCCYTHTNGHELCYSRRHVHTDTAVLVIHTHETVHCLSLQQEVSYEQLM